MRWCARAGRGCRPTIDGTTRLTDHGSGIGPRPIARPPRSPHRATAAARRRRAFRRAPPHRIRRGVRFSLGPDGPRDQPARRTRHSRRGRHRRHPQGLRRQSHPAQRRHPDRRHRRTHCAPTARPHRVTRDAAPRYAPCVFHVRRGGDAVCFLGVSQRGDMAGFETGRSSDPRFGRPVRYGLTSVFSVVYGGLLTCLANLQARRPDASEHLPGLEVATPWISVRFRPFQRYPSRSGSAVLLRKSPISASGGFQQSRRFPLRRLSLWLSELCPFGNRGVDQSEPGSDASLGKPFSDPSRWSRAHPQAVG